MITTNRLIHFTSEQHIHNYKALQNFIICLFSVLCTKPIQDKNISEPKVCAVAYSADSNKKFNLLAATHNTNYQNNESLIQRKRFETKFL